MDDLKNQRKIDVYPSQGFSMSLVYIFSFLNILIKVLISTNAIELHLHFFVIFTNALIKSVTTRVKLPDESTRDSAFIKQPKTNQSIYMIKTSQLTYAYENGQSFEFPDVDLKPGEHLLVIGPSGVGKTTLLYLMAGLLPPSKGSIFIDGTEFNSLTRRKMDQFRGEHIGIIFQQYHFIKSLSVSDNMRLRQSYPKSTHDQQRREELAERLGLTEQLNKKVNNLSQGQQQRLSIALGLIHKPKIIFADEPTSNLDDANCDKVIDLLKEEAKISNSSLVIITHDMRVKSHFKNSVAL
jgi:putative ABC transport system ATP-binding protein